MEYKKMNPFRCTDNQMKRFQNGTYHWGDLWLHYQEVKRQYGLETIDILRQLSIRNSVIMGRYLSKNGYDQKPAKREGTGGKMLRDALIANLHKTDWLPSTATYSDKLDEMMVNCGKIHAYITNSDNNNPELDVTINLDETRKHTKDELQKMFTMGGIVPKIVNISYSRYLMNANKLYAEFAMGNTPEMY